MKTATEAGPATGPAQDVVRISGKTFTVGGKPFGVRGVTYGSFLPRADGQQFPLASDVQRDFAAARGRGLNAVRTYQIPPLDVLEAAEAAGLRLLVGLEYLDWRLLEPGRRSRRAICDAGRRAVEVALEACRDHRGAIFGISVGNEIPTDVVRVHGISAVQDQLSELVRLLHYGDPSLLATYVSFPTTEYLDVEGIDFLAFNVFLERPGELARYIPHLHVIADERPVVISELGLAEALHGVEQQAELLQAQLAEVDVSGAAGAFVFSWTDEWAVAGQPIEEWRFGLTTKHREAKPALDVVERWARRELRGLRSDWPSLSVVVCAYNEERYLGDCLESLLRLDYPNLDVVICDDGSTDRTLEIACAYPFRVLALEHLGLSAARNAGLEAARGDLIAYLDADAACDPDWPYHLALSFEDGVDASGGPNLPVPNVGFAERVIAHSPGGPLHVLITDDRAEHVVGANMAFRRNTLRDLGGFDVSYTSAGDDVDISWRLLDTGHQIGFAHAAHVWHHRRDTVRRYLRQQRGYGRSERMVSGRHRERFNRLGQARWIGFLYSSPRLRWPLLRPVLYHGYLGLAPFQRVSRWRAQAAMQFGAALMPLLLPVAIFGLILGFVSGWALLIPALAVAAVASYAGLAAAAIRPHHQEPHPYRLRLLAGTMHAIQPFVRAWGRLTTRPLPALERNTHPWTADRVRWLLDLKRELARRSCAVRLSSPSDSLDLSVSVGPLMSCRITTAVVWNWQPMWRGLILPRVAFLLAMIAACAVTVVDLRLAIVPLALLALGGAEALLLCGTARAAIAATSSTKMTLPDT
jgi:glycosyltransferase involved in cell wall biosynthesis